MDNSTAGRQWSWDVLRKSQISFRYLFYIFKMQALNLGCYRNPSASTPPFQKLFHYQPSAHQRPFLFCESLSSLSSLSSEAPPRESKGHQGGVMWWNSNCQKYERCFWITPMSPVQLQFSQKAQKKWLKIPQLRLPVRHGTTVVRSPTRKWRARTRRVGTSPKKSSSMLWVQHIHVFGWGLSLKHLLPASQKCWSIPTQDLPLASGPERSKAHNGEHPTNKTKKRMQRATTPKDFFKSPKGIPLLC